MSVRLYVEGGGDSKVQRTACRRGFDEFLKKAGLAGRMPRVVACGGRQNAYDSFMTAHGQGVDTMLLVDSEGPLEGRAPWEYLRVRDGWTLPDGTGDMQCHLMVECMEAWFLADRAAVARYFGQSFRQNKLPANPQVESIPKADILDGLKQASRDTGKGAYSKGTHSFDILAAIDPARVENAAPHASRFLGALRARPDPQGRS